MADDNEIPYVNLTQQTMQHKEYSKKIKSTISTSLGELLQRVGNTTPKHDHHLQADNHHIILAMTDTESGRTETIPHNPFILSFHSLNYSVRIHKKIISFPAFFRQKMSLKSNPTTRATNPNAKHKILLNDISGEAREGEIIAVLGASGSGKSTLIDALANRISKESLKGTIKLNGEIVDSSNLFKTISAYVMQDDLLFPMLTVEETLMFSAEFRLPRTLSKSKKKSRVEALIDQLGLRTAAKTVIGDEGHRGVSGGERRRVSIGTDIIHDPIILFLDEPTSGLDSTNAYMVVQVLQRIAHSGSIVITSIHQPSYRILGLLDRLIFLSKGQTVFSGLTGDLPEFFAEFGRPIPETENRTEFALDLIRELEESAEEGASSLVEFNQSWQDKRIRRSESSVSSSSLRDAISASISKGKLVSGGTTTTPTSSSLLPEGNSNPTSSSSSVQKYANPLWVEVYIIGKRSLLNSRRMPELFGVRFIAVLTTGIILATLFWKLDDSPKGTQERLGFFAFAMSTTFYTCAEAIPNFLQERYIFMRETSYNAYRRSSYVLSQAIISIPSLLLLSFTFSIVTFWSVGLSGGFSSFLLYTSFIIASFWTGHSFVTFLSGVVSHVMLGYTVVVAILAYFVLFSGLFITRDRIPVYWIWFHYISLVKYPYEGVLRNEYADPNRCFVRGVQMFDDTPLESVPELLKIELLESMSKTLGANITSTSCVTNGLDVLKRAGVTDLSNWSFLWITVAWGFFFRFLFYFTLLFGSKNKRR